METIIDSAAVANTSNEIYTEKLINNEFGLFHRARLVVIFNTFEEAELIRRNAQGS